MRYTTDLKNVRGILLRTPLSAYGRKESRPRTERPSERRAFCTIREREAKLSPLVGPFRLGPDHLVDQTLHDSSEVVGLCCGIAAYEGAVEKGQLITTPNPARHLKDTCTVCTRSVGGSIFL
jgi:hypothetical protein